MPQNRFQHPEDAQRATASWVRLDEQAFGIRPRGVWPSEAVSPKKPLQSQPDSVSQWMATDEGVLGRSLGVHFSRDSAGRLSPALARELYDIYGLKRLTPLCACFSATIRLSDLIGFVYSGMNPPMQPATWSRALRTPQSVLNSGQDAVVSVILDGENAWEYYPESGREFLRRFYDALSGLGLEAVTCPKRSLAIKKFAQALPSLIPGSWINANFNVWIGAAEDNRAWDYLYDARNFYAQNAPTATEIQRKLALEEILIAEGSDWNWWYGPEHHSANDRDFDELYRKHLSNVYHFLGAAAPDYLSHPIAGVPVRPTFIHQTAYIHPRITGDMVRYFEWLGAARYTADHRSSAMHGKQFLLDAIYAGIDESSLYGRLDFNVKLPSEDFEVVVNVESWLPNAQQLHRSLRIVAKVFSGTMTAWQVNVGGTDEIVASSAEPLKSGLRIVVKRNFEFQLPLAWLNENLEHTSSLDATKTSTEGLVNRLRVRFSLFATTFRSILCRSRVGLNCIF